jgi:hypothetical protein
MISYIMAIVFKVGNNPGFELKAGVITAYMNLHDQ